MSKILSTEITVALIRLPLTERPSVTADAAGEGLGAASVGFGGAGFSWVEEAAGAGAAFTVVTVVTSPPDPQLVRPRTRTAAVPDAAANLRSRQATRESDGSVRDWPGRRLRATGSRLGTRLAADAAWTRAKTTHDTWRASRTATRWPY